MAMICEVQALFHRAQACAVAIRMSGGADKAGELLSLIDPDFHTTTGNLREYYWGMLSLDEQSCGNIPLLTFELYVAALESVLGECCAPIPDIPLARFYLLYQQRAGQAAAV